MTAKYEDSQIIKLNKEQLIEKIKTALDTSNMVVKEINVEEGIIRAKAKLNFWSWSENIHVNIADDGNVRIKSICAFPLQIYAWGKNKRNVNIIFSNLLSHNE